MIPNGGQVEHRQARTRAACHTVYAFRHEFRVALLNRSRQCAAQNTSGWRSQASDARHGIIERHYPYYHACIGYNCCIAAAPAAPASVWLAPAVVPKAARLVLTLNAVAVAKSGWCASHDMIHLPFCRFMFSRMTAIGAHAVGYADFAGGYS